MSVPGAELRGNFDFFFLQALERCELLELCCEEVIPLISFFFFPLFSFFLFSPQALERCELLELCYEEVIPLIRVAPNLW